MKTHTTNYFDTFIEVADDSKAECGTRPPAKVKRTIAELQYEMIAENPINLHPTTYCFRYLRKEMIWRRQNIIPRSSTG